MVRIPIYRCIILLHNDTGQIRFCSKGRRKEHFPDGGQEPGFFHCGSRTQRLNCTDYGVIICLYSLIAAAITAKNGIIDLIIGSLIGGHTAVSVNQFPDQNLRSHIFLSGRPGQSAAVPRFSHRHGDQNGIFQFRTHGIPGIGMIFCGSITTVHNPARFQAVRVCPGCGSIMADIGSGSANRIII